MRRLRDLWFRMRALLDRSAMQSELEEDFAFHLEKEAEKYEAQGLTPAEARRKARLKFGGEDRFKEKARESWGVDPLTDLGGDLRFAARQLRKEPRIQHARDANASARHRWHRRALLRGERPHDPAAAGS